MQVLASNIPGSVTGAASGRRARLPKDGKPDTVYWK